MSLISLLVLAVGLAMDATAVSAARGLSVPRVRGRDALAVALWFGGFQAIMPLAGWLLGASIGSRVERWDHWIAFGLLVLLGLKMINEARQDHVPGAGAGERPFRPALMLPLAIATSIDAFAVGITLPMLDASPVVAVTAIGLVTALLSAAGLLAGRRLGAHLGRNLEVVGGLVLIGLGVKILVEHVRAG